MGNDTVEKHCIGYGWLCAGARSWLDPGVGEHSALLLGLFLRTTECHLCAATIRTATEYTQ